MSSYNGISPISHIIAHLTLSQLADLRKEVWGPKLQDTLNNTIQSVKDLKSEIDAWSQLVTTLIDIFPEVAEVFMALCEKHDVKINK